MSGLSHKDRLVAICATVFINFTFLNQNQNNFYWPCMFIHTRNLVLHMHIHKYRHTYRKMKDNNLKHNINIKLFTDINTHTYICMHSAWHKQTWQYTACIPCIIYESWYLKQVQWMFETGLLLIVPDIKDKSEKMLSVSEDHCVCRQSLFVCQHIRHSR